MKQNTSEKTKTIFNRRLSHDFFIGKKFEAGSFIRLDRYGRPVWMNAYINDYKFGTTNNHEPSRSRFLLLNKREINEIRGALERKGESVFPVKLYFKSGLAKLEIAICKAKKLYDKRRDLKDRAERRDAERDFRQKIR